MSTTTIEKLLAQRTTKLIWNEPWQAAGANGSEVLAHIELRATVNDCIAMSRAVAAKYRRPDLVSKMTDEDHLIEFMVVHWAVPENNPDPIKAIECKACLGTGERRSFVDGEMDISPCPRCNGKGEIAQASDTPIIDAHFRRLKEQDITQHETWVEVELARHLERENNRLRAAIKQADEMHLGRCASSEPFTARDYRHHACEAREILRVAINQS